MISLCTCVWTLSLSVLVGRPSCEKSRPVSLSLMRFMTATARSLSTSLASPSCPYAFNSSLSRASRRGREGVSLGSGNLTPLPEPLLFLSGIFSRAAVHHIRLRYMDMSPANIHETVMQGCTGGLVVVSANQCAN